MNVVSIMYAKEQIRYKENKVPGRAPTKNELERRERKWTEQTAKTENSKQIFPEAGRS